MVKKKTVFILVDALRHDYVNLYSTSFFEMCKSRGLHIKKVKPSIGYCERVEILSGKAFPENGFFSAIGLNKNIKSKYWFLKYLPTFIQENKFCYKCIRYFLNKLNFKLLPYNIPLKLLPFLFLTEDKKDHTKKNAFHNLLSIVDLFLDNNLKISWNYTALGLQNGSDLDRITNFKKDFKQGNFDLFFLFLSPLDAIAHKYGPSSEKVKNSVDDVSEMLNDIYTFINANTNEEVNLFILGDHGMAEVTSYVNIKKELNLISKNFLLKPHIDFFYFIDSTSLRIWPNSRKFIDIENEFYKLLRYKLNNNAKELEVCYDKSVYGSKIWTLNEGSIFFPDFFHSNLKLKGMHGYDPKNESMFGTCFILSNKNIYKKSIEIGSLSDIAPTLCSLHNIDSKNIFSGTNWLNKLIK